ncbi:MAG: VWA domain-containing protein [Planctomycetes bacterium]|nr:VWA domain-containing protein [Planctomycetota bacterium]
MSFLNPLAFLWLLAAVPVILLYFLKLRRKRVSVSSTWLWVRSVQDFRVNAPFQRLRRSLLLFLQLLLILLATLALTAPAGRRPPPVEKRWVILIDRSASMQMKDVAPSRLAKAKEKAREILDAIGRADEVMVIAFAHRAQVMTPFTSSRAAAGRAIDLVEPADTATSAQEAFRMAVSAVQPFKNREIVVFSDGNFEPVSGAPEDVEIRYVPVGAAPSNAALTAIDVRPPARADDPWTVYAQLDWFSTAAREIPVELYVNAQLKAVKHVTMQADSSVAVLFEVSKPEPEVVEVRIAMDDDLAVDNHAWFVARRDRAKILLVGPGNFFLERAIANLRETETFRVDSWPAASAAEYDLVVLDRVMPEPLPEGRYLILGAVPKWEGIQVQDVIEHPAAVDWDRRHPAARRIDFSGLQINSSPRVTLGGFAAPVLESSETPLVFAWERVRTRALVVAFDVLQSDWPLRLSFPLFLAQAIEWLRVEEQALRKPGEPIRIRLEENETEVEIARPGGVRMKLSGERGEEVILGKTETCGIYSVIRNGVAQPMALNLLDARESSGRVATEVRFGGGKVGAAAMELPSKPLWKWFAAAALILLLLEWFVYHRRVEL